MTLEEYILKLEAAQAALPALLSDAAKNATLRAVEAAHDKTPPTADSRATNSSQSLPTTRIMLPMSMTATGWTSILCPACM